MFGWCSLLPQRPKIASACSSGRIWAQQGASLTASNPHMKQTSEDRRKFVWQASVTDCLSATVRRIFDSRN